MTNQPKQAETPQQLSPQTQQAIGKLNLRINDLLEAVNQTLKALVDENQTLQAKVRELQVSVKEKQ